MWTGYSLSLGVFLIFASSRRGFVSPTCCLVINTFCWWSACMYSASQQFMRVRFWHACNNCNVFSFVPYACLLSNMCFAYVDFGLFVCIINLFEQTNLKKSVTNLFKQTSLKVAFRGINTIQQQLTEKQPYKETRGIYKLKCNTCNGVYVGQSDRATNVRYKEHIRCILTNNPKSETNTQTINN